MTTLFEDGFENDLVPWSKDISAPNEVNIVNSPVHHGSKSCQFIKKAINFGLVYKNFAATVDCYTRFLVYFDSLPSNGELLRFFEHDATNYGDDFTILGILNNGGTMTWRMEYYNPGFLNVDYVPATAITTGQWYIMEVRTKVGNGDGIGQVYIDGTLRISQTALTNTASGNNVQNIILGGMSGGLAPAAPITFYGDCVKVSTDYSGVETAASLRLSLLRKLTRGKVP
jgi:hypothetical protein